MEDKHARFLLAVVCLALTSMSMATTTWYVNGVSGSDSNNCTSATTACKTIGRAISLAASGDSIKLAAATYTENLTFGMSLKILGSGAPSTIIDGRGLGRVVTISTGSNVTLAGVSIVRGSALLGAGISNSGVLKINQSVISGNQAHSSCTTQGCSVYIEGVGIYNQGALTISHSTVSNNVATASCPYKYNGCVVYGVGIYNHGGLTINYSAVDHNDAATSCAYSYAACTPFGGGIYNAVRLTINNSTISNNHLSGGLCFNCSSRGGGVYSYVGTVLSITNSTVTGNSASGGALSSGGGVVNSGTATASNATFSGNGATYGGNIDNTYLMMVQNSIVANSSSEVNCYGSGITSNGYNVSSDGSCPFTGPGDLNNTNPMLGPLQYNGGPTQTMALPFGSPAIDAGNPNGCTDGLGHLLKTDQRGMPRPDPEDTGGCDMGAYESQSD